MEAVAGAVGTNLRQAESRLPDSQGSDAGRLPSDRYGIEAKAEGPAIQEGTCIDATWLSSAPDPNGKRWCGVRRGKRKGLNITYEVHGQTVEDFARNPGIQRRAFTPGLPGLRWYREIAGIPRRGRRHQWHCGSPFRGASRPFDI